MGKSYSTWNVTKPRWKRPIKNAKVANEKKIRYKKVGQKRRKKNGTVIRRPTATTPHRPNSIQRSNTSHTHTEYIKHTHIGEKNHHYYDVSPIFSQLSFVNLCGLLIFIKRFLFLFGIRFGQRHWHQAMLSLCICLCVCICVWQCSACCLSFSFVFYLISTSSF